MTTIEGAKSGTIKWNGKGPINARSVPWNGGVERFSKTERNSLNFRANKWNGNRNDDRLRASSFRSTSFTRGVRGDFFSHG